MTACRTRQVVATTDATHVSMTAGVLGIIPHTRFDNLDRVEQSLESETTTIYPKFIL